MEGFGYEHFQEGENKSQQADYQRLVGDTQRSAATVSSWEGERYVRQSSHGHETAAQRYNATRIQAGLGPERYVTGKDYFLYL